MVLTNAILLGSKTNTPYTGKCTFTVNQDIKSVILLCYGYNLLNAQLVINNNFTTNTFGGVNEPKAIKIITNQSKTITLETTLENRYCYIDKMVFVI